MTSKARTLAGTVSTGAVLADGTIDASEIGNLTLPTGGDIVGTTATQTLTNKTLTDPIVSLGGTNGTSGQVLTSAGTGAVPTWSTPGGGGMPVVSYLSQSTTRQLANTDMASVILSSTVSGVVVKMPNATTLSSSQRTAILKNTGSFTLFIQDFDSNPLLNLDPNETVTLFCITVAAAAGTWSSDTYARNGILGGNSLAAPQNNAFVDVEIYDGIIARISETIQGTNPSGVPLAEYPTIQLIRTADGVQTVISSIFPTRTIIRKDLSTLLGATKTNTGQVTVFWRTNSGDSLNATAFTIDEDFSFQESADVYAPLTIGSTTSTERNFTCCSPSAGRATLIYLNGSNVLAGNNFNVNATTSEVTFGANISIGATPGGSDSLRSVAVGTNQVIFSYSTSSAAQLTFRGISNATVGTAVLAGSLSVGHDKVAGSFAGANQALFLGSGGSSSTECGLYLVSLSGTTITVTSTLFPEWHNGQFPAAVGFANVDPSNGVYFATYGIVNDTVRAVRVTLNGTTIASGTPFVVGPKLYNTAFTTISYLYRLSGGRRASLVTSDGRPFSSFHYSARIITESVLS